MKFEWDPDKNELNVRIISARKATRKEVMIYISGGAEE